jgi:riboflavin synthase
VSLTVAETDRRLVSVSVIPHTLSRTTIQYLKSGSDVNVETDAMAKHIEKLIRHRLAAPRRDDSRRLPENWLEE